MTKRLLSILLAALFTFSLAACQKESNGNLNIPTTQTASSDFQKNLHQTGRLSGLPSFVETDTGWYFSYGSLYYIGKEDMRATVVCAKPDCDHTDDNICNARIHADYLLNDAGKIFYVTTKFENGAGIKRVESVNHDATERKTVQELKFQEEVMDDASGDTAICHRGYIYYVSDYTIYRTVPGGEKDAAEIVWRPENIPETEMLDGYPISDPNELDYTLWADGDTLYFMANLQDRDGTYKDMLFACDLTDMTVCQVWVTPDKDEVGEWEKTGVEVSRWYVTGGYIYFYLSGGDMWRGNLSTGKNEKLADTHEKTMYGSAVFSDDYLCLLNDIPVINYYDTEPFPGSHRRAHGDTVFVYGLDGKLKKEISLKPVYDEINDLTTIELVCCAGNELFFIATSMTMSDPSGTGEWGGSISAVNLCHANIDTGEVSQIYRLR